MIHRLVDIYDVWHNPHMERTTVYLSEEIQRGLRLLAKRTRRPQAELIRDALGEYLARQGLPRMPGWVGMVSVGGDAGVDKRRYREQWILELDQKYDRRPE